MTADLTVFYVFADNLCQSLVRAIKRQDLGIAQEDKQLQQHKLITDCQTRWGPAINCIVEQQECCIS